MPSPSLLQRLKERKLVQWALTASALGKERWDMKGTGKRGFSRHFLLYSGLATLALAYPTHPAPAQQQQDLRKLTPPQAAEKLDEILYGNNLAGDVFIADVNGNQVADFVAIHRGGIGTVFPQAGKAEERFGGEEADRGLIGADFGFVVVSTLSVMVHDNLEWEADVIFLVAFGDLFEVPVASLSECHSLGDQPERWKICLIRAWIQGERADADLTFLSGFLTEPLPPHGYVQRHHEEQTRFPLLLSADGLTEHHFVTVSNAADGEILATVFVWGGERTRLELPEGSYRVGFTSGQEWGGPEDLFGPDEACHQIVEEIEMDSTEGVVLSLAGADTEKVECGSFMIPPMGGS
ncbi:hypothetical protein ACFL3S_03450 [Gemmatimonadota bacterium]